MSLTTAQKEKIVRLVLKDKVSVSKLARENNVARKTIYSWVKLYKNAASRNKKRALVAKYVSGKNHPKRKGAGLLEEKIIRIVKKNPQLSIFSISKALKAGHHAVYNTLKALELTTEDSRLAFSNLYEFPGVLDPSIKVSVVNAVLNNEKSITTLAKENHVARKTIYEWIKEFKAEGNVEDDYVSGFAHPRAYSETQVEAILNGVVGNPAFSIHKLAANLGLSSHGVYNVLFRYGLTHSGARFAYSQNHQTVEKKPSFSLFTRAIKSLTSLMSPNMLPAPPPNKTAVSSSTLLRDIFLVFLGTATATLLVTYFSFATFSGVTNLGQTIGLVFAETALAFGSFFFLYSLKYYLSLAIVLSYSQKEASGLLEGKRGKGILSSILGETKSSILYSRDSKAIGLMANLDNIHIKRHPFVSVHIPFYNEKNVVRRSIEAAVKLNYPSYEVILCDDSTDETTKIIREYQNSVLFKGEKLKIIKGDGWEMASVEVKPGVTLKHFHRTTRHGFKGAALELARKLSNPKTEFISVFDADFVPYPDSLELFLKYFKAQNKMDENYKNSNIAAVQGYQWHVLNKSENWITRGVRSEYAGSYVIERSGIEIYGGLKQISGSVYMIRKDVLDELGWGTSITEDFELTLKLYEKGYKVLYTPYVQAPAECVSTLKRFVRQRMRWAEGHSFNVKKMFIKLALGQRDEEKAFVPSKLTLAEKLELLYLSPYYLQAFFFLIGTLSWLISETIFQVRLPFWTELWGWSLVLTNIVALPLVNTVGMFMEESQQKDYLGIGSFLALCYLVVPFQAYAAVKGFLEKEEGTWFRTPKTGRITDVLNRSMFMRFVERVLPVKNGNTVNDTANYLALSTANNQFNNFNIKSKKGRKWIGKSVVSIMLAISTTLTSFAPYVQVNKIEASAPGAGIISGQSSNNVELTPVRKESFIPNLVKSVRASDETNVKPKTAYESKTKDLLIKGDLTSFTAEENPNFQVKVRQNIGEFITKTFKKITGQNIPEEKITVTVVDSKGNEVQSQEIGVETQKKEKDIFFLELTKNGNLVPGKYSLVVEDSKGNNLTQDFTWGVLAINTNKSIYLPHETAQIALGVLDNTGTMVCNARVSLFITSPSGVETELSRANNKIIVNTAECSSKKITLIPDYQTSYQVDGAGVYQMALTAFTDNGSYTVKDSFEVKDEVPFDIERISATRIYPRSEYPVIFKVKANINYKGVVGDQVPTDFAPSEMSEKDIKSYLNISEDIDIGMQVSLDGVESGDKKIIKWFVDWKKGGEYYFGYTYKAPFVSPAFYLLGPLWIGDFQESRAWQIASDSANDPILFWDGGTGNDAPSGWSCISCSSGQAYYQIYPRGAASYSSSTGGSSTHTHTITNSPTSSSVSASVGGVKTSGGSGTRGPGTHTHAFPSSGNSVSNANNVPAYQGLKMIQRTGIPTTLPQNVIAMFDTAPTGSCSWTQVYTGGNLARGMDTIATGGSNIDSHTITTGTTGNGGSSSRKGYSTGTVSIADNTGSGHTHNSGSGATTNDDLTPPYHNVLFYKNNTADCPVPVGILSMFDAASPDGWDSKSGSGGDFENKFVRGYTAYAGTGGAESLDHANATVTTSGPDLTTTTGTGSLFTTGNHTHTYSVALSTGVSHLPVYRDTVIAKYNPPTATVDGYFRDTDEATAITTASGTTVKIVVEGGSTYTPTLNSSGYYQQTDVVLPTSGNAMLVFLDTGGVTNSASAVTIVDTSAITLDLYKNRFIIRSDKASTPITNQDLADIDSADTDDLFSMSTLALTVNSGIELHVNTSDTYDPGGTITTQGVNTGDLHIDSSAVIYIDSGTSIIAGDVDVDGTLNLDASVNFGGATFVSAGTTVATTGTHTFTSSTTISGGGTINFYNLATSGTGTLTLSSTVSTDNNVSVGTGTTLKINADLAVNGGQLATVTDGIITYDSGTPTVTLAGTGDIGVAGGSGSILFYNLTANGSSQTTTLKQNVTIANALSVGASHVFAMGTTSPTIGSNSISDSGDITMAAGSSSTHTSGTVTVLNTTNAADWSGPGTFTANNLTIGNGGSMTVDNETSDLPLAVNGTFTISGSAVFQSSSTAAFNVAGNWSDSGTFTPNSGTVVMDATAGTPTITTAGSSFNNLSIDNSGTSITWTLQDALDVNGNLLIDTNNTLDSGSNRQVNIAGNLTVNGTYTANSNTTYLDGAVDSTQVVDGSTTFYNLIATTGDRIIKFGASDTFVIASGGTFTATGDSCTEFISIRSTTNGSAANLTKTGSISFTFVDVQDINVSASGATITNSVNSGGNTNLSVTANACIGASTGTATGYSFQRKTFYDTENQIYWLFYHDGDEIEIRYSSDGSTWYNPATAANGRLSYDTNDFSVWWQKIGTTSYVWLAVVSGNDIKVRQGVLSATDVAWDSDVATILDDADARCTSYSYPGISLDVPASGNPHVWVMANCHDGTNYVIEARSTSTTAEADPSSWTYNTTKQITNDQTTSNVFGNIVPLQSGDMYATFVVNTTISGCRWDSDQSGGARWENSSNVSCEVTAGGGDTESSHSGPVNINDASNFGTSSSLSGAGRQIVRTKSNVLYTFLAHGGNCEMWKSANGTTWTQVSAGTSVTCDNGNLSAAIDNNEDIHVVYINSASLRYRNFDTATDAWDAGGETTIYTENNGTSSNSVGYAAIAIDNGNIPHVTFESNYSDDDIVFFDVVRYNNRIGGSWNSTSIAIKSTSGFVSYRNTNIIINESGALGTPEISFNDPLNSDLYVELGNANDATSFTEYLLDSQMSGDHPSSMSVNPSTENTWLSYTDYGGTVALAKYTGDHTSSQWNGTYWTTITGKTDLGYQTSIAIAGSSDIYVFYQEDSTDQRIAYDVYDSNASTPAWAGEVILETPGSGIDFSPVKAKWSYEWNNFGTNRIDFLYSNGTDVFWDYLYMRRNPINIDDSSNPGMLYGAGRQVVRTSSGILYSFIGGKMYKSTDNGATWTQVGVGKSGDPSAMAIGSDNTIHVIFGSTNILYDTFSPSTDTFAGLDEVIHTYIAGESQGNSAAITLDSNNVPHVLYTFNDSDGAYTYLDYDNRIGGSWNVSDTSLESNATGSQIDIYSPEITINESNYPEVVYYDYPDSTVRAKAADANDPTTWASYDVDTTGKYPTIGIDTSGNTWIAYQDSGDTVSIAKYSGTDYSGWATAGNWTVVTSKTDIGYAPSLAVDGTSVYVFYQNDQNDIVYDKYSGSAWSGETLLEQHASLKTTKVRWSRLNNPSYSTYGIDYLYSDNTDMFFNRVFVSGGGTTTANYDSINTSSSASVVDNLSAVSDSSGNVHLLFVDSVDGAADQISYMKWNGTSWGSAVLAAGSADDNDAYVSISLNTTNAYLYAVWIDTGSGNDDIYYSYCDTATGCDADTEWVAESGQETLWKSTGVNTNITVNYSGSGRVFAIWTVGSASPYAVQFGAAVVPELIWFFFPFAPLLPLIVKRRKKGKIVRFTKANTLYIIKNK